LTAEKKIEIILEKFKHNSHRPHKLTNTLFSIVVVVSQF